MVERGWADFNQRVVRAKSKPRPLQQCSAVLCIECRQTACMQLQQLRRRRISRWPEASLSRRASGVSALRRTSTKSSSNSVTLVGTSAKFTDWQFTGLASSLQCPTFRVEFADKQRKSLGVQ